IAIKRISNLLLEFDLFEADLLGEKILNLIETKGGREDFQYELLSIASKAFAKAMNQSKSNNVKIQAAEALVRKANQAKIPGQMLASSHWLSQAISAFQKCEGQQQRILDLQEEMTFVNKESLKEMKKISCTTDITEIVNKSVLSMQNKTIADSIIQFAYLSEPLSKEMLEKQTIELAKKTVFQSTTSKRIINGDGRLTALVPPLIGSNNADYDLALQWECYQQANHYRSLIVNGVIVPAKNEILKTHFIDENVLMEIFRHCSFILPDRINLWVKGFAFGFYNDFDIALSLLIPQFEHALRKCLENKGATVWRVESATQFHYEKTLGELLRFPEATELLGENLQFELQDLLTEKVGFNFRNEALHGLVSQSAFYTPNALYLWWLLLHVVVQLSQFPLDI
ncbi:TPA: DUF4209 domain-containing protein, partial [Legionella pneumophila]|nr:DUF4209 domain-containing protein [Legionella pneumophila]